MQVTNTPNLLMCRKSGSLMYFCMATCISIGGGVVNAGGPPPVVVDYIEPTELVQGFVPQHDINIFGSDFVIGLPSATNRPTVTLRHVDGLGEFSGLAWVNLSGTVARLTRKQINLLSAPLGNYDVIITRPIDKASDTLEAAFTITDGIDSDSPQVRIRSAWGGLVNDVAIVGDLAYAAIGRRFVVLDISDEMNPLELGSLNVLPGVSAVAVAGNYAYIQVFGLYGFSVVDVSDPTHPILVDAGHGYSWPGDVHLYGNIAYVRTHNGVRAFDITNPTDINLIMFSVVPGSYPNAMTIVGDLLYMGSDDLSVDGHSLIAFRVFDLAVDPLSPPMIGDLWFNLSDPKKNPWGGGYTRSIAVEDDYAFWSLRKNDYESGQAKEMFLILDVSNPESPTIVSSHEVDSGLGKTRFTDVVLSDGLAYVTDTAPDNFPSLWRRTKGLIVFDIATDPANPKIIGTFKTHGDVMGLKVVGNRAYLNDLGEGLIIMDISNPAKPVRLGNYHSPAVMRHMVKSGDLLYVADAFNGFTVLDVTDAAHPQVLSVYLASHIQELDECSGQHQYPGINASGIDLQDNKIYLSVGHSGLEVIDVTDPADPTFLGALRISELADASRLTSKFIGVNVWHDVASIGYEWFSCGEGATFFLNLNISDPANIFELGRVATTWEIASTIEINTNSGVAFLGYEDVENEDYRDWTIDTSEPSSPELLYSGNLAQVTDVALNGNILYVASNSAGIYIQNVTNPASPGQLAQINIATPLPDGLEFEHAYSVAVQGDYLAVAGRGCVPHCGRPGLYMFNVANLHEIVFLDVEQYIGGTESVVAIDGSYVYTTNEDNDPFGQSIGLVISEVVLPITADLDGDGVVGHNDLIILLANWGPCPPPEEGACPADLDGDGSVGTSDLLELFANWG